MLKWPKKSGLLFVIVYLIFIDFSCAGSAFEKLNYLLLNQELENAKVELDSLHRNVKVVSSRAVNTLHEYDKVYRVLIKAEKFNEQVNIFEKSHKNLEDINILKSKYNEFSGSWSILVKNKIRIGSVELVNLLNNKKNEVQNFINVAIEEYKTAVEARKRSREEAKRITEEKRRADEKKRELAAAEAEKKRKLDIQKKKIALKKKKERKLLKFETAAKKLGYKGIYRDGGIVKFLYNATNKGGLKNGIGKVFWSGISESDSKLDSMFKLSQVVDGWEVYEFSEWSKSTEEWIRLSICIPIEGLPIEGQHLKNDFYVFEGNRSFTTVTGVNRIVQIFKPLKKLK